MYSIIELVHLCGYVGEMCRDGAQETAGNSWLCNVDPEGESTLNADAQTVKRTSGNQGFNSQTEILGMCFTSTS